MKRWIRKWWWIFLLIPLLLVGGFVAWGLSPLPPMPEAISALESDGIVEVETEPWIIFRLVGIEPELGVILYPGGHVDPRAYAPPAREMAAQGYLVVITPMPLNLAVFSPGKAQEVIQAFPQIKTWIIGGHSLGGSMAANYAVRHPDQIQGLYFWASYPASNDDLSAQPILVASIYGTSDGVAPQETILAAQPLLPAETIWAPIEGGNHAQFGWYGDQPGDNPALITRQEQQNQTLGFMLDLIRKIQGQ